MNSQITLSSAITAADQIHSTDVILMAPPRTTRRAHQRSLSLEKLNGTLTTTVQQDDHLRSCFEEDDDEEEELEELKEEGDVHSDSASMRTLVEEEKSHLDRLSKYDGLKSSQTMIPITSTQRPAITAEDIRLEAIRSSWLHHTELDVLNTAKNGPMPHCTVEELSNAMDNFFGVVPVAKSEKERKIKKEKSKKGLKTLFVKGKK